VANPVKLFSNFRARWMLFAGAAKTRGA